MKKSKVTTLKYFALGLALSVFILSLVALWVVFSATPIKPQASSTSKISSNVFVPTSKNSVNFLITMGENSDKPAQTFILLRINPLNGQIPVCVFNQNTAVKTDKKSDTLGGFYSTGGILAAKQALEHTFEIKIDRYVKATYDDFVTIVNRLGLVEFTVPYNLDYEGSDRIIKISSGKQLINGAKLLDIMRFPKYKGGELERMNINAEVIASFVNQFLDLWISNKIDDLFNIIINLVDTDFTVNDFEDLKQSMEFVVKLSTKPSQAIYLDGKIDNQTSVITPSAALKALVKTLYGSQ